MDSNSNEKQHTELSKLATVAEMEEGAPSPVDQAIEENQKQQAEEGASEVGYNSTEIAAGLVSSIDYSLKQFVGVQLDDDTKKTAVNVYSPCFEGDSGMALVGAAGPWLKWGVAIGFTALTAYGVYRGVKEANQAKKPAQQQPQQPQQPTTRPEAQTESISENVPVQPVVAAQAGEFKTSGA